STGGRGRKKLATRANGSRAQVGKKTRSAHHVRTGRGRPESEKKVPSQRRTRCDYRLCAKEGGRMSTAKLVPETRGLTGDDAWAVLKRTGWGRLAKDAFKRMRVADGFSHARSLAFLISLVAIEGLIGVVGLASVLTKGGVSAMIDDAV